MNTLTQMQCVACRPGEPTVSEQELAEYQPQVPEWQIVAREGEKRLERVFTFSSFAQALAFTDAVGALAEAENHHPAILTEWGRVRVTWWTHAIGGLHRNDFIMAAKSNEIYGQMGYEPHHHSQEVAAECSSGDSRQREAAAPIYSMIGARQVQVMVRICGVLEAPGAVNCSLPGAVTFTMTGVEPPGASVPLEGVTTAVPPAGAADQVMLTP